MQINTSKQFVNLSLFCDQPFLFHMRISVSLGLDKSLHSQNRNAGKTIAKQANHKAKERIK